MREAERKIGDLLLIYGQKQLTVLVPVHKHESRNIYLNKHQYQLHQALQEIAPVSPLMSQIYQY